MKTLCVWHSNCQDGFAAAWAVRHALGEENVEFYPGVYQEAPPDATGRDVVFVDFSYKRPIIEKMAETARSILILDHHKSALEDLAAFPQPGPVHLWRDFISSDVERLPTPQAIFDMDRSGAGLAWDYFHPGEPRPRLIDHIEDRDLWRFALSETRNVAAALFSHPYDFDLWDRLMKPDALGELMIGGRAIERKHHQDIDNLLPVVQREMVIGGIRMPVANLPLTLTSDAGHRMASHVEAKCAACYWDTPDGRIFSLRSLDDGPDVQKIAVGYGGGGHAHASGFKVERGWEGDVDEGFLQRLANSGVRDGAKY